MIQVLFFLYISLGTALAFSDWRRGIYLMLIAGMLQDPVRKLMPEAPAYMVLAFLPIFVALCMNFFSRGRPWARFLGVFPVLGPKIVFLSFTLFLAVIVVFAKHGAGAWKVAAIGMISYGFPLIAVVTGFWFIQSAAAFKRLILFYCVGTAVLLAGGLLEHWHVFPQWRALGTDALGMTWVRHVPGYVVQLTSGFYRSPDLLGWHAALLVMFSLSMSLLAKGPFSKALWLALATWGIVILLISGRNKMIFMPVIFVATVALAYMYKGNIARSMTALTAGLMAVGLFWAANTQMNLDEEYLLYVGAGSSAATERLSTAGALSIWTTFQQSGFFGEGLGTAATGARFGGASGIKTWQESGTSKIMVELGVMGFIAMILFGIAIFRTLLALLRTMPSRAPDSLLFVGLLGILIANLASFVISHQAFGDPFIVVLTGLLLGLALSAPRWLTAGEHRAISVQQKPRRREAFDPPRSAR